MELLRTKVCSMLVASVLLVCAEQSVAQLGGRRALKTWVPQSGSYSVETGLVYPKNTVKRKTDMTWDHNAKPPAPAEKETPAPAPPAKKSPASAEKKDTKGHKLEASFSKQSKGQAQVESPVATLPLTNQYLVKAKPSVSVSVDTKHGIVHNREATDSTPTEKKTVYLIEEGDDSN